jgi:hypothetical protein
MNVNDECPNCKSGTLEQNDKDLVCRGECGATFNPLWMDDRVQFARLLCELIANDYNVKDTATSMDLDGKDINELLDRAHAVWEGAKTEFVSFRGDPNADYTNPDGSVRATRYTFVTCVICAGIAGHCEHTRAPVDARRKKHD